MRGMFENLDSPDVLEPTMPEEAVLSSAKGEPPPIAYIRGKTGVITLSHEASMTLIHKDQWLIDHRVPRS